MTPLGMEHWEITDERKVNGRMQITARYLLEAACCIRCGAIAFPGVLYKHGRLGTIYNERVPRHRPRRRVGR